MVMIIIGIIMIISITISITVIGNDIHDDGDYGNQYG